jgi:hypothetical protein
MKMVREAMQALLERMMPFDYKTLHIVKSLALHISGGQVRAASQHRDQPEPHP